MQCVAPRGACMGSWGGARRCEQVSMVQAEEMATHRPEGNPECGCVCVLVHACMCGLMSMHMCTCVCGVRVFMCTYMNLYLHVDTCSLCA